MKNVRIVLASIAVLSLIFAFTIPDNRVVGRWNRTQTTPDGPIDLMFIFRADSTFDGIVNGKAFVTGRYFVKNDTMRIADNSCHLDYYGTYRLRYLPKDSLLFTAISDTCKKRYEGANGLVLKRMLKK